MSLKCGIVGLPNVGKSTLFNALTAAGIEAQNFPFCTIEPNKGVVAVPDQRLSQIADIVQPEKIIPTTTEFVDIAGLVKGASEGEGLGNKFLSHIRETQAIIHVIRCFENPDITHVHDSVDPIIDLETVETELLLADIETLNNSILRLEKASRSGDKEIISQKSKFEELSAELSSGKLGRNADPYLKDKEAFRELGLITVKPCIYIGNVEDLSADNELLNKLIQDIKNEIDESEKLRTEAKVLLDNAQKKLDTAQSVSREILEQAKKDSDKLVIDLNDKFHKTTEIKKNLAENKIDQMKEAAIKEIKDVSIKIAVDSVKKIITTSVDKSKLDTLFQKNLDETKEELKKINS